MLQEILSVDFTVQILIVFDANKIIVSLVTLSQSLFAHYGLLYLCDTGHLYIHHVSVYASRDANKEEQVLS